MVTPHTEAADISKRLYDSMYDGYHMTQATLALAYEQRTANLIAWRNGGKILIRDIPAVDGQIRDRLGLE